MPRAVPQSEAPVPPYILPVGLHRNQLEKHARDRMGIPDKKHRRSKEAILIPDKHTLSLLKTLSLRPLPMTPRVLRAHQEKPTVLKPATQVYHPDAEVVLLLACSKEQQHKPYSSLLRKIVPFDFITPSLG